MTAVSLPEIRAGLATRLATLPNVQTSAYMLSNPTPPTLQVMGPDEILYDQSFRGALADWTFIIQGFVGSVTDEGSQVNLDQWLAPSGALSVKAALEGDRSAAGALGGVVQDLTVQSCSGYRFYQLDNRAAVLGAEWTVWVRTVDTT